METNPCWQKADLWLSGVRVKIEIDHREAQGNIGGDQSILCFFLGVVYIGGLHLSKLIELYT